MSDRFYDGAWVFLRRHGQPVTCGEITGRNARHPQLHDVWPTDGGDEIMVSLTEQGQEALRSVAPDWAMHAVDTEGCGRSELLGPDDGMQADAHDRWGDR